MGTDRAVVDVPLGDLAPLAGVRSSGTVTYYLRCLHEAGLLVRRRPMVVDLSAYRRAGGTWRPGSSEAPGSSGSSATIHTLPGVAVSSADPAPDDLLRQITDLVGHVGSLAALVVELARNRESSAVPVAPAAKTRGEGRKDVFEDREQLPAFLPSRDQLATGRETSDADRGHVDGLIDRLCRHRLVDAQQLTARQPLRQALLAHPPAHREHAVDRLLADLVAGRGRITNVFGCLHHKATIRDPDYFCDPPPRREPIPEAPSADPIEPLDIPVDQEALEAVGALDERARQELGAKAEALARAQSGFRQFVWERVRSAENTWELELAAAWRREHSAAGGSAAPRGSRSSSARLA